MTSTTRTNSNSSTRTNSNSSTSSSSSNTTTASSVSSSVSSATLQYKNEFHFYAEMLAKKKVISSKSSDTEYRVTDNITR